MALTSRPVRTAAIASTAKPFEEIDGAGQSRSLQLMHFYRESEPLGADVELPTLRRPAVGWILLSLGVVLTCSYLLYMPSQRQLESRFASQLARQLKWYPLEFPNTPMTNLAQVLYGSQGGYPYQWHEWFRNYGASAGFANSLAEKYVMVPPGVVHRREEIYLVSAQPYFEKGRPRRMVIYRQSDNFGGAEADEDSIKRAFEEAGRQIPAPTAAAKPPPPPPETTRNVGHYYLSAWLETRGLFSRLEWWGMAPRTARIVEKCFWWVLGAVWVGIIAYCWRPVPAKVREPKAPLSEPMTAGTKIWTVIGLTLLFILSLGCLFPGVGGDRGYEQLFMHLLFPYHAAWEEHRGPPGNVGALLLWGQILVYDLALSAAWVRNHLRFAATVLAIIHLLAIGFSILVILLKR